MLSSSYSPPRPAAKGFGLCLSAFLQSESLPFADVLSQEQIEEAFAAENVSFARDKDDIFLGDCAFSSYFMLALLLARGVDVVFRQHQRRKTDFRRGRQLGREDHGVVWQRPACPEWMNEATYATIPETLTVRELKVHVAIPGFRTKEVIVATTLTDAQRYTKDAAAALFRRRWHVELDLRNIKVTLHMDDLRGRTPQMVRRELQVLRLAYNLLRKVMAQGALVGETLPRELSFAGALSAVVGACDHATVADDACLVALAHVQYRFIASFSVGHRPNRVEPRAIKRRPKSHKLLRRPRDEARATLLQGRAI